jgi:hypothetical protein
MLKDKLMKIKNLVRAEHLKYETQLQGAQKDNVYKTKKYKEFTNMFKDVQAQYARFQEADDNRIKEVYTMNVAEAQELVEKIMHCDEVIHLQQLSIPWKRPTEPIFSFLNDSSQQNQDGGDGDADGASAAQGNNASLMDSEMKGQSRSDLGDGDE